MYPLYDNIVSFSTGFENYTEETKETIIKAMTEKYKDWPDMIHTKYSKMYSHFSESGKSKLYQGLVAVNVQFKHPTFREDGSIVFVGVMNVTGKRAIEYYYSIGKFNINLYGIGSEKYLQSKEELEKIQ